MCSFSAGPYVGLEYEFGGRGPRYDCWGLACLIYRQELGITLPCSDSNPDGASEVTDFRPYIEAEARQFVRVDTIQPFDLVMIALGGVPAHIGIALDSIDMIHLQRGCNAVIERFDCQRWRHRLWGTYRHRDLV